MSSVSHDCWRRAGAYCQMLAIPDKDRKVGVMVKALAVEVSGFESVKGTTKEFLEATGFYVFRFPSQTKADEFRDAVRHYIPQGFVQLT